jgi:hypothetical protein
MKCISDDHTGLSERVNRVLSLKSLSPLHKIVQSCRFWNQGVIICVENLTDERLYAFNHVYMTRRFQGPCLLVWPVNIHEIFNTVAFRAAASQRRPSKGIFSAIRGEML